MNLHILQRSSKFLRWYDQFLLKLDELQQLAHGAGHGAGGGGQLGVEQLARLRRVGFVVGSEQQHGAVEQQVEVGGHALPVGGQFFGGGLPFVLLLQLVESPGYLIGEPHFIKRQAYNAALLGQGLQHRYAEGLAQPDLLLPVPLAKRRLRERGFNQAGMLTRWLSSQLGIACDERVLAGGQPLRVGEATAGRR